MRAKAILPVLILLLPAAAGSQLPRAGITIRGTDAERLARGYERTVHGALSRYFADNTFLVRARVEFDDADPADAPAEPSAPALPGLPYQPDLRVPGGAPDERLRSVLLDVLVDTSYTQRDRDFVQYLVALAANLDTVRGDELRVVRAVFPRDDRSLQGRPLPPPQPVANSASGERDADTVVRDAAPKGLGEVFLERLIWILPLVVAGLFFLAAVWILNRPAVRRVSGAMRARLRPRGRRGEGDDDASSIGPVDEEPVRRRAEPVANPQTAAAAAPQLDSAELKPFLVNAFVGDPKVCGQILCSWIERDPAKGMKDAGALLSGGSHRMLELVRDALGPERSSILESRLASGEEVRDADFLAAAREFRREFRNATVGRSDPRDGDLFGFLEQLNEAQIMHILKDEPLGISGFALAQVSPAKAGSILQKLDPPSRARLMYAIGNVTQIPREVYKQVADRLSLKALEVANMKFVAADGVESLIHLIESLPVDQQFQYIHSLSEVDLNLAKKVRARTITFPELPALPDKFLAARIQALEPETLALALLRLDQEQSARMLSLLPERMRMLMQSAMEGRKSASPSDVEAAQNALLRAVREEIRRSGRPT